MSTGRRLSSSAWPSTGMPPSSIGGTLAERLSPKSCIAARFIKRRLVSQAILGRLDCAPMTEIERLRALAAGAREAYPEIKARCEARATRWEWATFALYSPEPAYFEVHKFTPGDRLPGRPARSGHGYGFDPTDQIVLEHQLTELPGRFYETFYERAADGFARYHFHYSREKELINVGWFSLDDRGRVSAIDTLYSAGSWRTQIFRYEERLQTIEHRTEEAVDFRDLEWDAQGRIARVYWRYPDGRRILDYERPSEDRTFAVNRRELRLRLGDAIRSSLAMIGQPVQAVALHWCGAEYQHRLPPHVAACTASELEQLRESFGDELDSVW